MTKSFSRSFSFHQHACALLSPSFSPFHDSIVKSAPTPDLASRGYCAAGSLRLVTHAKAKYKTQSTSCLPAGTLFSTSWLKEQVKSPLRGKKRDLMLFVKSLSCHLLSVEAWALNASHIPTLCLFWILVDSLGQASVHSKRLCR